jgi:hypothetical protein
MMLLKSSSKIGNLFSSFRPQKEPVLLYVSNLMTSINQSPARIQPHPTVVAAGAAESIVVAAGGAVGGSTSVASVAAGSTVVAARGSDSIVVAAGGSTGGAVAVEVTVTVGSEK